MCHMPRRMRHVLQRVQSRGNDYFYVRSWATPANVLKSIAKTSYQLQGLSFHISSR